MAITRDTHVKYTGSASMKIVVAAAEEFTDLSAVNYINVSNLDNITFWCYTSIPSVTQGKFVAQIQYYTDARVIIGTTINLVEFTAVTDGFVFKSKTLALSDVPTAHYAKLQFGWDSDGVGVPTGTAYVDSVKLEPGELATKYQEYTGDNTAETIYGQGDLATMDESAIDLDNITEGSTNKFFTATDESKLGGIESLADVTSTNTANNTTNVGSVTAANLVSAAMGFQTIYMSSTEDAASGDAAFAEPTKSGAVYEIAWIFNFLYRGQNYLRCTADCKVDTDPGTGNIKLDLINRSTSLSKGDDITVVSGVTYSEFACVINLSLLGLVNNLLYRVQVSIEGDDGPPVAITSKELHCYAEW